MDIFQDKPGRSNESHTINYTDDCHVEKDADHVSDAPITKLEKSKFKFLLITLQKELNNSSFLYIMKKRNLKLNF